MTGPFALYLQKGDNMFGFSRCDDCPVVNRRGGGGLCDCVNPFSDWWGVLIGPHIISGGAKEIDRIKAERNHTYHTSLENLFPNSEERRIFLETPRKELGGLSINGIREACPYGIEVSEDIVAYLVGTCQKGGGVQDRWLSNAMNGYFFAEERDVWLNSTNELLGGKTNREIAESGGHMILTEILWFLLLENPTGKDGPMFREPSPMSSAEEEMLLDEYFPESQAYNSYQIASHSFERLKQQRLIFFVGTLILIFIVAYICFTNPR